MPHTLDTLIKAMRNPAFYPHTTHTIQVIHTHISTIFLTGEFAYKIKKPVNFGFLDFTQLADRKHFCKQEVSLNRRLAPELYLGVVPIVSSGGVYHLSTESPVSEQNIVEYAVKMRQFNPMQQLDRLLEKDALRIAQMDELATRIARFHQQAETAPADSRHGLPESVLAPARQNFLQLRKHLHSPALLQRLEHLESWTQQSFGKLQNIFQQRRQHKHIRACHGDMHLGNMAVINNQITLFDGIEFNEDLRWIDTASDLAFLLMDLEDHDKPAWSHRLLNTWLSETGDFAALQVMKFYQCYRALVRAKVNALRLAQLDNATERRTTLRQCENYLQLATGYTKATQPCLLITHGLSGSGKSHGCLTLVEQAGFIQLRSDVERKRLAGMHSTERDTTGDNQGIYHPEMSRRTYAHLLELAKLVLDSAYSVVVDATFLHLEQRLPFRQLAADKGIPFLIIDFTGSREQLEKNILQRQQADNDASDAGIDILHKQLAAYKPLQDDEPYVKVRINEYLPLERINAQLARLQDKGS